MNTTRRYLSTNFLVCKTIYLFDLQIDSRKIMAKMLEMVGLVLVAIMTLAFVGAIPGVENGLSYVFWACAGGVLLIILYRKRKRKQEGKEN